MAGDSRLIDRCPGERRFTEGIAWRGGLARSTETLSYLRREDVERNEGHARYEPSPRALEGPAPASRRGAVAGARRRKGIRPRDHGASPRGYSRRTSRKQDQHAF